MKKSKVKIDINTGKPTTDWATGRQLLNFLTTFDDRLVPQFLDNWGVKRDFESVEACEPFWAPRTTLTRTGPDSHSSTEISLSVAFKRSRVVRYTSKMTHTTININGRTVAGWFCFEADYREAINWGKLFEGLCDVLGANSGRLHCFGNDEKKWSLIGQARFEDLAHHFLVPAKYVQEQTRNSAYYIEGNLVQKISDKGFSIEKFNDGYLIKVSDKLDDVLSDYETFSRRRDELKCFFPPGTFRGFDPV